MSDNSEADLVSIDPRIRASHDGLDYIDRDEQNGSFSNQPYPTTQVHRKLACSCSLPNEVSASEKIRPPLKVSKSSPKLLESAKPGKEGKHIIVYSILFWLKVFLKNKTTLQVFLMASHQLCLEN